MIPKVPNDSLVSSQIHQRLSELITALIKEKDIRSERGLGRITGLANTAIRAWMQLKVDPKLSKLIQFTYNIGWSMTELMAYAEGEQDPKELIELKKTTGSYLRKYDLTTASDSELMVFLEKSKRFTTTALVVSKDGSESESDLASSDVIPELLYCQRLRSLLYISMAIKGIPEKDILDKTDIPSNLFYAIQELDWSFEGEDLDLEPLAPHLYQVQSWQELLPVFKQPLTNYDDVSKLQADLTSF